MLCAVPLIIRLILITGCQTGSWLRSLRAHPISLLSVSVVDAEPHLVLLVEVLVTALSAWSTDARGTAKVTSQ